ncbi:cloroquine resistance associated Cg2 [Babesia ovis]|uniref:Mediator of RNA polymerase II transcription subunit 14 n=1 Tax=Babesia ovis TaxID=5869 RepID=A0A9W5WTR1_BABOV|nr:cloroquine resistance associated Cg2 [Babesia ovis]
MDDFQTVSFMDLLSQCVQRCIVDWRCFCYRQLNDESYVDSHARTGIIQFARAQREIFLKLYLLHEFSREQGKLDKFLEGIHSFDNYLEKCGRDLAMNLRKVQTSDLLVACPNTALAVDLLSTGRYTRMPTMLPQLAHSATTNTVPMPPISPNDADLAMERIYSEYRYIFKNAECRGRDVKMECHNGQCILTHENMFRITLIYDFCSWQALAAVPLVLDRLGCSTDGDARTSFLSLVMYAVAIYNTTKHGNIFDTIFDCANLYSGKLIMERLRSQACDYRGLRLGVTDYRYYVSSDPDHTLLSCSDVSLCSTDLLVLETSCFPGFKQGDIEGLTLKFQMDHRGDISLKILELPHLLDFTAGTITEHRLDQWLDCVAQRLERHQLDQLDASGNFFMNYSTGALTLMGLSVPFSLHESGLLLQVIRVRDALLAHGKNLGLVPADNVSREALRQCWLKDACSHCALEAYSSTTTILHDQLREATCDFWTYLEDKPGAVHGVVAYKAGLTQIGNPEIGVYVTVATHNEAIVGNKLLVTFGSEPLGLVGLSCPYSDYAQTRELMVTYLHFVTQFADICGFHTNPFSPGDDCIVGFLEKYEVSIKGTIITVKHAGTTSEFGSLAAASTALRQMLKGY